VSQRIGPEDRPMLARRARMRFDERSQESLLLAPERGLLLNLTATAILQLCDGKHTVAEIVACVANDEDAATATEDVLALLQQLHQRHLLDVVPGAP